MGIGSEAEAALAELLQIAGTRPEEIVVVGGSTSEVLGEHIGKAPTLSVGHELMAGLLRAGSAGPMLAIQCCEHLNRALVVSRTTMRRQHLREVSAYPIPGAGGALACAAMELLPDAVLVETVEAYAGLDIGLTLIGMHLRPVAVPLRLTQRFVGKALVTAARSRPKLVGGRRAVYERPDGLG